MDSFQFIMLTLFFITMELAGFDIALLLVLKNIQGPMNAITENSWKAPKKES